MTLAKNIISLYCPHSKNKIGENGVDIYRENCQNLLSGALVLHDLKFDYFTSLSRQERQRNVSKCKMEVQGMQNYCLC